MRRIDRVQRGDEPPLLRGIQPGQRIKEVRFVDRPRRLRLVQQEHLGSQELDAIRIAPSQVRDVEADARSAAVYPPAAVALFEEELDAPRAVGCLARPDLVAVGGRGRLAALPPAEI